MNEAREQGWKIAGATSAVALVLVLLGIAILSTRNPSEVGTVPGNLNPSEPLAGGVAMSLSEAAAVFPVPLYRPEIGLGSDQTLANVWVRTDDPPEAYLEYESGLVVLVRPSETGQSTKEFADAQMKDGVPGSIVEVDGVSVFLVPQTDSGSGSARLVVGDAIVTAIGDKRDFSVEELRSIAVSVVESANALGA